MHEKKSKAPIVSMYCKKKTKVGESRSKQMNIGAKHIEVHWLQNVNWNGGEIKRYILWTPNASWYSHYH